MNNMPNVTPIDEIEITEESSSTNLPHQINGTMQNRFLNLDNFFIFLAYDDLIVGISDGANCFW